jgi:hypothetical protein
MTENLKQETLKLVHKEVKTNMESMLKKVEEKYTEVVKERATNDIHNQNFAVKQQYPEKCYVSFILKNGEFVVPYETGSIVTLAFESTGKLHPDKVVTLDTSKKNSLDIKEILTLIATYDFCTVTSITKTEFELFDEEKLEKEDLIVRVKNEWSQTFEGCYRCSDVVGVYQNITKINVVDDAQA